MMRTDDTQALPKVSILVPTLNCVGDLPGFLTCIRAQTYPADAIEVLVIDNGSNDGTYEAARAAGVIALRREERGRARALNTGITAASGTLLLTTDLSCRPASNWVDSVVRTFEAYPRAGCVAGDIKMLKTTRNAVLDFQERANYMSPLLALNRTRVPYLPFADGANASFRKSLFDEIGGFEETFVKGADVEICYRMFVLTDYELIFNAHALVWEAGEPTLRALLHQRFRMGIGANLMQMKFPGLYEQERIGRDLRSRYWALRGALAEGLRLLQLNLGYLFGRRRDEALDADIRLLMKLAQRYGLRHGRRWLDRQRIRPTPIDAGRLGEFLANAERSGQRVKLVSIPESPATAPAA
jgi:glycosyltransferase involved in cell wall biosynthesis